MQFFLKKKAFLEEKCILSKVQGIFSMKTAIFSKEKGQFFKEQVFSKEKGNFFQIKPFSL